MEALTEATKAPAVRGEEPKPRLQDDRLQGRTAPDAGCLTWICGVSNHNETLVHGPVVGKPKADRRRKSKNCLKIVKLEERVAPRPIPSNHNETLVRDRA